MMRLHCTERFGPPQHLDGRYSAIKALGIIKLKSFVIKCVACDSVGIKAADVKGAILIMGPAAAIDIWPVDAMGERGGGRGEGMSQ